MADRIADVDERLGTWLPYNWTTFNPCGQIPDEIIVRPKKYGVVDTLIFDIDDTLYPVESGFTEFRNSRFIHQYMVDHMGFQNLQAAKLFRDEWFGRYHSTVKGFVKAGEQGMLPRMPDGTKREFDRDHLISYYGKACDPNQGLKYLLPCVDNALQRILGDLRNRGIQLVIFTNGPRAYGLRVLKALKLLRYFDNHLIFGVDTIAPFCKPERESFLEVLRRVGADPSRSVMFEDSLKNIRACKKLGMRTVLITGRDPRGPAARRAYASKGGDLPIENDPSVDAVLETCGDMQSKLPCLWLGRWDDTATEN